jgi:hypothetical protein
METIYKIFELEDGVLTATMDGYTQKQEEFDNIEDAMRFIEYAGGSKYYTIIKMFKTQSPEDAVKDFLEYGI